MTIPRPVLPDTLTIAALAGKFTSTEVIAEDASTAMLEDVRWLAPLLRAAIGDELAAEGTPAHAALCERARRPASAFRRPRRCGLE